MNARVFRLQKNAPSSRSGMAPDFRCSVISWHSVYVTYNVMWFGVLWSAVGIAWCGVVCCCVIWCDLVWSGAV